MLDILITFAISALLFAGYFAWIRAIDNDEKREKTPAVGKVTKVVHTKHGAIYYYVEFCDNGKLCTVKTTRYSRTNNKYSKGDSINILYYMVNSHYSADVDDPDLVSTRSESRKDAVIILVFAVVFFAGAVIALVNHIM